MSINWWGCCNCISFGALMVLFWTQRTSILSNIFGILYYCQQYPSSRHFFQQTDPAPLSRQRFLHQATAELHLWKLRPRPKKGAIVGKTSGVKTPSILESAEISKWWNLQEFAMFQWSTTIAGRPNMVLGAVRMMSFASTSQGCVFHSWWGSPVWFLWL